MDQHLSAPLPSPSLSLYLHLTEVYQTSPKCFDDAFVFAIRKPEVLSPIGNASCPPFYWSLPAECSVQLN